MAGAGWICFIPNVGWQLFIFIIPSGDNCVISSIKLNHKSTQLVNRPASCWESHTSGGETSHLNERDGSEIKRRRPVEGDPQHGHSLACWQLPPKSLPQWCQSRQHIACITHLLMRKKCSVHERKHVLLLRIFGLSCSCPKWKHFISFLDEMLAMIESFKCNQGPIQEHLVQHLLSA